MVVASVQLSRPMVFFKNDREGREVSVPGFSCRFNRSVQHFVEVYWQEF
jgi:hypothetical protein